MALLHQYNNQKSAQKGQLLIELLVTIALVSLMIPALLTGFQSSRSGRAQQDQRFQALSYLKETQEVLRVIRDDGWNTFSVNGTYHPVPNAGTWTLMPGSETIVNNFTRQIVVGDVFRDSNGAIVQSGGTLDPATKKVVATISWTTPLVSSVTATSFISRFVNTVYADTSVNDFTPGTKTGVVVTNTSGGEVSLAPNTAKGKWCSPSLSSATIALPDGPPVAVVATASASTGTPNDVFVATSPTTSTAVKLAYVTVSANVDPPVPTLKGTFTLNPAKYSSSSLVPTGIGLDNSFITNGVKYYKSSAGKLYALLATTKPDKEVIAIQINDGNGDSYQDPTNKIYKYWTFFNTRIYQGTGTQDQAPYGAGASSLAVLQDKGYVASGGFLYVFDLSNIDTKSPTNGLDMVGCRIELDGYDCNVSTSKVTKYASGSTGTTYQAEQNGLASCNDGGNTEIYGDNDIFPVRVGANVYVYVAVGAGTDPELNIVSVTSAPTTGSSPTISSNSCGTIASGNSGWKRIGALDFNANTNTQETANSVYASLDGNRAYISSNGGVDANNDGKPDSWQLYIIDTSDKTGPKFLSGTSSTGAQSGYYYGTGANAELYPRRSLTVLNGQRAVLVGKDGITNANNAQEYQVVNIANEAAPSYCGGINFDQGFNDLTSVSEADGDNFVYMVANTPANELKIIEGGPDGTYTASGTYESPTLDLLSVAGLNRMITTATVPSGATLKYQIASMLPVSGTCTGVSFTTADFIGPDGTGTTYFPSTGGAIPISANGTNFKNPAQCVRYRAYFSTTDTTQTPILSDVTFNYSP